MERVCICVRMILLGSSHPFGRQPRYGMTSHPGEGKNGPPTTCGTIRGPIGTIGISYSTRSTTNVHGGASTKRTNPRILGDSRIDVVIREQRATNALPGTEKIDSKGVNPPV